MLYSGWITAVCTMLEYDANITDATSATPTNNTAFNNMIAGAIDYTENRLQRDLDLLGTVVPSTGVMVANQRKQVLPQTNIPVPSQNPSLVGTPIAPGSILTTTANSNRVNVFWPAHGVSQGQYVSLLIPVTVANLTLGGVFNAVTIVDADNLVILAPTNATSAGDATVIGNGIYVVCSEIRPIIGGNAQAPLEFVSRETLDNFWPSDASVGANVPPVQWTANDQTSILVGPAPDQAYGFEAVGTMRVPQLSAANYTNLLTQWFPDLYLQASLVFWFQYQRDFGAQAENPQTAQSAENQYQLLLKSAGVEEARKRLGNMIPSPSNPVSLEAG